MGLRSCCAGLYELPLTEVLLGRSFHPGGADLTRRLASLALVHRGSRVLDVASGRGETAAVLAKGFGCHVTSLDYSETNLGRARDGAAGGLLADKLGFVRGDAECLPFADGAFDVAFCECALCTFGAGDRAAEEMRRVLAPRGRVAISDVTLNAPVPAELQSALGHALCIANALSVDGYVELLEGAGFRHVRARDASESIVAVIDRVERGLERARDVFDASELDELLGGADPAPVLESAREFARSGGIGYALFTARAP